MKWPLEVFCSCKCRIFHAKAYHTCWYLAAIRKLCYIRPSRNQSCGSGSGSSISSESGFRGLMTEHSKKNTAEKLFYLCLIKNSNLLLTNRQKKPSALKREHPPLKKIIFINFFLCMWVNFSLLDPDPQHWEEWIGLFGSWTWYIVFRLGYDHSVRKCERPSFLQVEAECPRRCLSSACAQVRIPRQRSSAKNLKETGTYCWSIRPPFY
jgi:hypothetical protein